MALTKPLTKKKRATRRNQFGVTLLEKHADLLRAEAERLKVSPTTLAAQLLERTLAERASGREASDETLVEIRRAVRSLSRAHHNGLVKLLQLAGMSSREISVWVKRRLVE